MTRKISRTLQAALLPVLLVLALTTAARGDLEDTIDKSFSVGAGGTLNVETQQGSIEVEGVPGNQVTVKVLREVKGMSGEEAREILDKFPVEFEQRGNDVFITAELKDKASWRRFWDDRGARLQVRFIVTVPEVYNLDLKTSGGSIDVEGLEGSVLTRTSGGSLVFERIRGTINGRTSGGSIRIGDVEGDTEVDTSGGSITINSARGEVDAHTSGGSITVNEVAGAIQADTSGGSIKAVITRQPAQPCRLTTSGGSITVYLGEDIAMDVNARTSGGRVNSDIPVTVQGEIKRDALQAAVNGGGPELYLRTSGGSIHLKKR